MQFSKKNFKNQFRGLSNSVLGGIPLFPKKFFIIVHLYILIRNIFAADITN